MIFVTVGAQMPFDRLIRAVDAWTGERGRQDVFAQIGPTDYRPEHMEWTKFLNPPEFNACFRDCTAVVAHAGMGTLITALELGKPILVMPRRADLHETRNDHQLPTAKHFGERSNVDVAYAEPELSACLDRVESLTVDGRVGPTASPELVAAVRSFIEG